MLCCQCSQGARNQWPCRTDSKPRTRRSRRQIPLLAILATPYYPRSNNLTRRPLALQLPLPPPSASPPAARAAPDTRSWSTRCARPRATAGRLRGCHSRRSPRRPPGAARQHTARLGARHCVGAALPVVGRVQRAGVAHQQHRTRQTRWTERAAAAVGRVEVVQPGGQRQKRGATAAREGQQHHVRVGKHWRLEEALEAARVAREQAQGGGVWWQAHDAGERVEREYGETSWWWKARKREVFPTCGSPANSRMKVVVRSRVSAEVRCRARKSRGGTKWSEVSEKAKAMNEARRCVVERYDLVVVTQAV